DAFHFTNINLPTGHVCAKKMAWEDEFYDDICRLKLFFYLFHQSSHNFFDVWKLAGSFISLQSSAVILIFPAPGLYRICFRLRSIRQQLDQQKYRGIVSSADFFLLLLELIGEL